MAEPEPYSSPRGVENAIKDAARRAASADPSLDVNKRIQLEYFNRFLSRVFSQAEDSEWVLKGGTGMLARVPSTRATRDIDLYRRGFSLTQALEDLVRLAAIDLGDHFRFQYVSHTPSIGNDTQPYTDGYQVRFEIFIGLSTKGSLQVDLAVGTGITGEVTSSATPPSSSSSSTTRSTRREATSAHLRARTAGLDPAMRIETWDELDDISYDRQLLMDLTSLRFTDAGHAVLILGPVGVGKTHLAHALGHTAIRRRLSVHAARADKLFTRLRAARLDNTLEAEIRRLARVDVLILDDFALRRLDTTETNDFYELIVERHRKASTIITSNRDPAEWLAMMSDTLLAQSAIDRLTAGAHTLIIEGPSYRQRSLTPRAGIDTTEEDQ